MSATQLLRDNHKIIRGLFRQFEAVDRRAHDMKSGVVKETFMMIETHLKVEETFFYPAVEEAASAIGKALAVDCRKEHEGILLLIRNLNRRDLDEENFNIGFTNLITTTEEHFEKEENDLFLLADTVLGEDLYGDLAPKMAARRKELMEQPQYMDARPEVVQMPNGGEQKRIRRSA